MCVYIYAQTNLPQILSSKNTLLALTSEILTDAAFLFLSLFPALFLTHSPPSVHKAIGDHR